MAEKLGQTPDWVKKNINSLPVKTTMDQLYPVDPITGFGNATARATDVAAAQRNIRENGGNFTYIDIDVNNAKGLAQTVGGSEKAWVPIKDMVQIVEQTLAEKGINAKVYRHAGHAQGDEFSIVAEGNEAQVKEALNEAQRRIQEYAKKNGLDQIPHTKEGKPAGVGLAFGTQPITADASPLSIYQAAEANTEAAKNPAPAVPGAPGARPANAPEIRTGGQPDGAPSVQPEVFDPTAPLSEAPASFNAKNADGKNMSIAEYSRAVSDGTLTARNGLYYSPEGKVYAAVRHPFDPALDRVLEVPKQDLTPEFEQRIKETNAQIKGGKYNGTIERLNTANRPLNWALMLTGGKGVIDQYHAGQLTSNDGLRSTYMLGAGLSGEVGQLVALQRSESQLANMTRAGRVATNTVNGTGSLMRGVAHSAAPLILYDAHHDFVNAFKSLPPDPNEPGISPEEKKNRQKAYDPNEPGISPEEKKARTDNKALYERRNRENTSGGYFFGAMDSQQHDVFKGATKTVAGVHGSYVAFQGARTLMMSKAEKELAKQAAKIALTKAGGSALGMAIPGVNLIMATDMLCDLAVDSAERHAEQGLQLMNQGVAIRNNMRATLPRYTDATRETWNDLYDFDITARTTEYNNGINNVPGVPPRDMDRYVTLHTEKNMAAERIAKINKKLEEIEKDPSKGTDEDKARLIAGRTQMQAIVDQNTASIAEMAPQLRASAERAITERVNADANIPADRKAQYIADEVGMMNRALQPENANKLAELKKRVIHSQQLHSDNAVAFGTRERTVEIMRQFPNIYMPLERAGMLSGPNAVSDDVLAGRRTYKDSDGKDATLYSTYELQSQIDTRQRALAEEIDALHDEVFNMEGLGGRLGTARTGNAMPVDIGHLGTSSVLAAGGMEYGNTVGVDTGDVNSVLGFVIHGQQDNSYSSQLAKLQNYRDELAKSNDGGHPKDNSPQLAALQKVDQMIEKIRLVHQLEDAKKSIKKEGIVEHQELGPDRKP